MDRYQRRPARGLKTGKEGQVVEAVQLTKENVDQVIEWCDGTGVEEIDALDSEKRYVGINIPSWGGVVRASEGDFVIKDHLGEFHTRWPDHFNNMFEKE